MFQAERDFSSLFLLTEFWYLRSLENFELSRVQLLQHCFLSTFLGSFLFLQLSENSPFSNLHGILLSSIAAAMAKPIGQARVFRIHWA